MEAVPGMAQAQPPAQPQALMEDPSEPFTAASEMQHGTADDMPMQQQQAVMDIGQPQLTAVDMEA